MKNKHTKWKTLSLVNTQPTLRVNKTIIGLFKAVKNDLEEGTKIWISACVWFEIWYYWCTWWSKCARIYQRHVVHLSNGIKWNTLTWSQRFGFPKLLYQRRIYRKTSASCCCICMQGWNIIQICRLYVLKINTK